MRFKDMNLRKKLTNQKTVWILSLLLLITITGGVVLAYLHMKTGPVVNTFLPVKPGIDITEEFEDNVKKNVSVKNTGEVEVYARIKLVTYRVNEAGERIGGLATLPDFTPNENWVYHEGFYYYTKPLAPGAVPDQPLLDSITLEANYEDADGGRQVLEVMAECIQSQPEKAVGEAWGVTISEGSVTAYTPG